MLMNQNMLALKVNLILCQIMMKGKQTQSLVWIAVCRRKITSSFVITFPYYLFSSHTLNRYSNFSMKNHEKCNPNTSHTNEVEP